MSGPWLEELWRVAILALTLLVVELIVGRWVPVLLAGTVVYLTWHLVQLYRFERWVRDGNYAEVPDVDGMWGALYQHWYRLNARGRERERKLAGILDRFREATTAMPDATVVMRANGQIEWFNEAARRLFGLDPAHDVGQYMPNLVRHPVFVDYLKQGDFTEPVELPSPANEKLTLQVHIVPYGKDRRLVVGRDVTRIQHLEQMRKDFVANVSHELRTPLTVISGYLETLLDDAESRNDEQSLRSLKPMQEQTGRMQRIVDDLLLLSRLEMDPTGKRRDPISVPSLLAGIRDDARRLAPEKQHSIELEVDDGLWLHGNEQELRSAFANLVFNAVRYTPANGRIRVCWQADDGGARLAVSDTGIGIPAHHIPRLTERFYRVDVGRSRETGGTGLGLAIVKHVLHRHSAALEIESTLGKGSTFICRFPPSMVARPGEQSQADASGSG